MTLLVGLELDEFMEGKCRPLHLRETSGSRGVSRKKLQLPRRQLAEGLVRERPQRAPCVVRRYVCARGV